MLRNSAIVLGSGTGACGFTVPTVLIAPSSVVVPPAEVGTSSNLVGQPSQRAGRTTELERVIRDRVNRGDHVRLANRPLSVPFKTPVTVSGEKSVSGARCRPKAISVKLKGVLL